MNENFEEFFYLMPKSQQAEVLHLLKEALRFRSGIGIIGEGVLQHRMEKIAEIFARNGREIEEYT